MVKFKHFFILLAIVFFLLFTLDIFTNNAEAATGINRQINFQGKLVNNPAATNVTDTSYTVVFTLYNNPNAGQGTALWTETQTVTTVDGIFRVALGSVTPIPANFNFNWDGLYLGIKVNSDSEMTPRIQMAAVPFAFNAEKVAGLTVQDTSGNASTSGTLQVANGVTVKLPTSGTGLIYADTASTGTLTTLSNSTTQTGNVIGQAITLSGATGSLNQTGLQFNLSGATSGTVLDIQGTGNSWYITRNGALTVASCTGCGTGGGGVNWWNQLAGALSPVDTTNDLLIGSTATTSALFSFTGIKTGQTIASASGNLIVMPNNGWGGRVGIGTTNPTKLFEVSGNQAGGVARIHRISSSTNGVLGTYDILAESTGDMTDGFGVAQTFSIEDNAGVINYLADIRGIRSGADNTGSLTFSTDNNNVITEKMRIDNFGKVGIDTSSPLATLDVRPNTTDGGTIAVASISGITSFAALVANNDSLGDLFTASKSGLPIFTVKNNGQLVVGAPYYQTGACTLKTDSTGLVTCGTDLQGGGGGTSYIEQSNGLTYVGNTTTDFAIGGTSTSSAAFIFGGANSRTKGGIAIATFSGALMMEAQANSSSFDQTNWQQISGTAGTIGNNTTTAIASISAMASYNGNIFIGTYKNDAGTAEIYRYNNNGTNWTLVSQSTPGTIASGGTAGIASISAMTVFDGYLYAGTSKMNQAEIYRYDGGTTWTKITSVTPGTIGAITAVDGVSALAVYQGKLYAGTRELGGARLMRWEGGWTWTSLNGTAGTFVTTNTVNVQAVTSIVGMNGALYFGIYKPGDADVLKWTGAATFLALDAATATGSYSVNGANVTGFDTSIVTIYNGNLIVGLSKINGAEVLAANPAVGETGVNTFTRLNNASGQMMSNGTSGIDTIASMTVYNGLLYVGTYEPGKAEIYRYSGGPQPFMLISQSTPGTIASGGNTSINGVMAMVPMNGDLYAGTMEVAAAEVYKLSNVNISKSYSILFHAQPSLGGGEQPGADNLASIFFLASASANLGNSAGNSGAFIFDHGIQTRNGSYDVAEDYPTRDDTLKPGDVVAIDKNEKGFVKKTSEVYDSNVVGVFSANPALRLSQADAFINGGYVVPVALAGRVPVKVSTESGEIKPGDYLTPSSVPGVAMKALKSSVVFGQAMEGYSGEGIGKVLVYIKSMTYQGAIADNFANFNTNSPDFAVNILDQLKAQNASDGKSNIIADRLIAGLEIITPSIVTKNLTADTINAKTIKVDRIEGLEIYTNRLGSLADAVKSLEALTNTPSVLGTATSGAALTKDNVLEKQNPDPSNALTFSSLNVDGLATVSADFTVKGSGFFQGALNVLGGIATQNLLVSQFAYFINDVVFKGNVRFNQTPMFSKDTAGFAVIKKDGDTVQVTFDQEYNSTPIVTASIVFDKVEDNATQKQLEDVILNGNITYVITQRTTKGFVVRLNKPTPQDLNFSWVALSVKDAKTSGLTPLPNITPDSSATPSAAVQSILNQLNNSPGPPN
ncbi:MAG: hypothetical protein M1444_01410 [Patescibacteria group bacterium]|nr:hypothetical protein [Patescibacteria group bacterium]